MKMIFLSKEGEIRPMEYPSGNHHEQRREICTEIGCDLFEVVRPKRLYEELGMICGQYSNQGESVAMIVDEEGLLKDGVSINTIASWLYETDKHGNPIVGNVIFVGERETNDGIEFCGIERETFEKLFEKLIKIAMKM